MGLIKEHRKVFIAGAIFGLIIPFVGLFFGLQVSQTIGNILTFPHQIITKLINTPFGELSPGWLIFGFLFSMALWGLIFVGIAKVIKCNKIAIEYDKK